jgi:hypothetical protein
VRLRLAMPFVSHAYYAKIEINFTDSTLRIKASPEESVAALQPLLERLMPLLLEEYFNWDADAGRPASSGPR